MTEISAMKGDGSAKLQSTLQDINASLSCMAANDHQEDTRNMLEKILDKVDSIDLAVKAKADTTVVLQLEKRLQSLENKLQTNSEVMQKLEKEEADRLSLNCKVEEVVAMLSDKRDEWKDSITNEIVMEKLQSKLNEDELEKEDQEKRRNSVIIFGLQESGSPEAEVRVAEDVDKMQSVMKGIEIQYVMNVKS